MSLECRDFLLSLQCIDFLCLYCLPELLSFKFLPLVSWSLSNSWASWSCLCLFLLISEYGYVISFIHHPSYLFLPCWIYLIIHLFFFRMNFLAYFSSMLLMSSYCHWFLIHPLCCWLSRFWIKFIHSQVTGHTCVQELMSLDSFSKSHIALPFHDSYIIVLQFVHLLLGI